MGTSTELFGVRNDGTGRCALVIGDDEAEFLDGGLVRILLKRGKVLQRTLEKKTAFDCSSMFVARALNAAN